MSPPSQNLGKNSPTGGVPRRAAVDAALLLLDIHKVFRPPARRGAFVSTLINFLQLRARRGVHHGACVWCLYESLIRTRAHGGIHETHERPPAGERLRSHM